MKRIRYELSILLAFLKRNLKILLTGNCGLLIGGLFLLSVKPEDYIIPPKLAFIIFGIVINSTMIMALIISYFTIWRTKIVQFDKEIELENKYQFFYDRFTIK